MDNKERIKEVFNHYGYLDVEAFEPDLLDRQLAPLYLEWKRTGKTYPGGYEVRLTGCWTDIFDALMEFWNPYGDNKSHTKEAKEEIMEWMDSFVPIYGNKK